MNLDEKLERSKSTEKINFSVIGCTNVESSLIKVENSGKIIVEPVWTLNNDFEGKMYADYIAEHPEYDGIYVREELLMRLLKAADSLDGRYKLVVRAGHRPLAIQKRLLKECSEDYKKDNPGISDKEALEHARTFVSDPETSLPPHCCGAAVDVELFDASTNQLVDFGSSLNDDNEQSFLYAGDIADAHKLNRQILLKAMLGAGLASCKPEWWHFSYGDQVWAWFYGKKDSLYAPIDK